MNDLLMQMSANGVDPHDKRDEALAVGIIKQSMPNDKDRIQQVYESYRKGMIYIQQGWRAGGV